MPQESQTAAHGYLRVLLDEAFHSWRMARRSMLDEKEEWRQRWQLLTAALIYSRSALRNLGSGLHVVGGAEETPAAWKTTLGTLGQISDLSDLDGEPLVEIRAGMDSASASFRIVTAMELADRPRIARCDALIEHLEGASTVGCYKDNRIGVDGWPSLAIVIAHRDSFGHGEEGDVKRRWHRERHEHFVKICHCRIIEAQLRQIWLALDALRSPR